MCVIRSMHADVPNHEPSLMLMNCGDGQLPRPSMGSWVTYGLGTENQNLPGFIAMCPGGYPIKDTENWQSAFLPGIYQGTYIDTQHTEVDKLIEQHPQPHRRRDASGASWILLRTHQPTPSGAAPARPALKRAIQSFELAYRMQMEATDAFDVEPRTAAHSGSCTARACRPGNCSSPAGWSSAACVTCSSGTAPGQPWDSHDDLEVNHRQLAGQMRSGRSPRC